MGMLEEHGKVHHSQQERFVVPEAWLQHERDVEESTEKDDKHAGSQRHPHDMDIRDVI